MQQRCNKLAAVKSSVKPEQKRCHTKEWRKKSKGGLQRGETEDKNKTQRDRSQIRAGVELQQAKSNHLTSSQRGWHSSPTKGDSAINSINPVSIPSSSPHWVNTHLHHTASAFLLHMQREVRRSEGSLGLLEEQEHRLDFLLRLKQPSQQRPSRLCAALKLVDI